ncbi:LAFA_0D09010g1_1 [Lachancea sp. 'fantastica']|nr:LAFA_0D09010g1_1 [Lachancea sp. 'fantastica']
MATIRQASPNLSTTASSGLIRTSKTWVLPPRTRPGRRPRKSWQQEDDDEVTDEMTAESSKKARNRDAQRAFRERQSKQVVELQQDVAKWREKCAFYKQELEKYAQQVKRLEKENQELTATICKRESSGKSVTGGDQIERPLVGQVDKCDLCTQDLCICRDTELDAIIAALKPSLRDKIDSFKPMEAVALPQSLQQTSGRQKRRKHPKNSETKKKPKSAKEVKISSSADWEINVEGLQVTSQDNGNDGMTGDAAVISDTLAFQVVDNEGCGFCSESSACLCKDDMVPQADQNGSTCASTHKRLLKPAGM